MSSDRKQDTTDRVIMWCMVFLTALVFWELIAGVVWTATLKRRIKGVEGKADVGLGPYYYFNGGTILTFDTEPEVRAYAKSLDNPWSFFR